MSLRASLLLLPALTLFAAAQDPGLTPAEKALADRARALSKEGVQLSQQGRYREAVPVTAEVVALREKLYSVEKYPQGHPELAIGLNNLAGLHEDLGEYDRAEPLYRRALEMFKTLYPPEKFPQGHPNLATSLNNLAYLYSTQRQYGRAEPLYRQALEMRDKLYPKDRYPQGHPDLAQSLNNLAGLYQDQGEYGKAEPFFRRALEIAQTYFSPAKYPQGHPELARSLNNLALVHQTLGEFDRAQPLFASALAILEKLYPQGDPELVITLNNLAGLHQDQKDYDRAGSLYRRAQEMSERLYPPEKYPQGHPSLAMTLNNLASLQREQENNERAGQLYRRALEMTEHLYPPQKYPQGHPRLARSLNNVAAMHLIQGEYAQAEPLYRKALEMTEKLYPAEKYPQGHPELSSSLNNLAVLHEALGDYARAEPLLRRALQMQAALLVREADTRALAESLNLSQNQYRFLDAYLRLGRAWPDAPPAYAHIWLSKGRIAHIFERRNRDLLASADPATRDLQDQLNSVRQRLAQALLRPLSDAGEQRKRLADLTTDKERLERDIAVRLRLDAPRSGASPTLADLRKALPVDAALIDLCQYAELRQDPNIQGSKGQTQTPRYVAFVVTRDREPVRIELGEAKTIDDAWAKWHRAINAGNASVDDERSAAALFAREFRWADVRAAIPSGVTTLFVSSTGPLNGVPLAALPGTKSGTVLLEEFSLTSVPSPTFLLEQLTREHKANTNSTALIVGGVDYGGKPGASASDRNRAPLDEKKRFVWQALPGSEQERKLVADLATTTKAGTVVTRSGSEAGTERISNDLTKARYAHLATHGFFADAHFRSILQVDAEAFRSLTRDRSTIGARNPLVLSGLVFAGANLTGTEELPDRGIATAEAIVGKRLVNLELAVLSACDTGLGEVAGGEGVLGLQRAFHVAGCPSVIASLWKVEDEATSVLMGLFYRNLWQEKQSPREALRNAQLALYRNSDLVKKLSGKRGIDFTEVDIPPPPKEPTPPVGANRTPTRQWAAFSLSGVR